MVLIIYMLKVILDLCEINALEKLNQTNQILNIKMVIDKIIAEKYDQLTKYCMNDLLKLINNISSQRINIITSSKPLNDTMEYIDSEIEIFLIRFQKYYDMKIIHKEEIYYILDKIAINCLEKNTTLNKIFVSLIENIFTKTDIFDHQIYQYCINTANIYKNDFLLMLITKQKPNTQLF